MVTFSIDKTALGGQRVFITRVVSDHGIYQAAPLNVIYLRHFPNGVPKDQQVKIPSDIIDRFKNQKVDKP